MATPTPTQKMSPRPRVVKARKRSLVVAHATYDDLAREARCSWSMAWKWVNDVRKSRHCQRAFDLLTANGKEPAE